MSAADLDGEVVSTEEVCPDCSTRERTFDELAKSLADGKLSRRKALRMLGAAVMGGVLASVPGMAWAAKPTCAGGATKCGSKCCPDSTYVCSKGKCACPAGTTPIGNTCCQNAQVCGSSCGCPTGQSCVNGGCVCPAATPTYCAATNTCVDIQTDPANCGGCNQTCTEGQGCADGTCQDICPAVSCCCSCRYELFEGPGCTEGAGEIYACNASADVISVADCTAYCQAHEPIPGYPTTCYAYAPDPFPSSCVNGFQGFMATCGEQHPGANPNSRFCAFTPCLPGS
jgi:hypothetical protein